MIEFTQYLRPDGRTRTVTIERPKDIEDLAEELRTIGARFEVEQLPMGDVSLECLLGDPEEPKVLGHEIAQNGPEILDAVDKLVIQSNRAACKRAVVDKAITWYYEYVYTGYEDYILGDEEIVDLYKDCHEDE